MTTNEKSSINPTEHVTETVSVTEAKQLQGTLRANDSLGINDLPPRALEFLGLMRSGKKQLVAEAEMHVTGEEMLSWKQNDYFRSKCASFNTANWGSRELTSAYIKANEFEIARTMVKRATDLDRRDSQRAGETLFEVTGVITKTPSVVINNQVQSLSLELTQYQRRANDTVPDVSGSAQ